MGQEKLTLTKLRELIVYLEPVMDNFDGSFDELHDDAIGLCKRVERELDRMTSVFSSVEALLLAALVNRLKYHMRNEERELAPPPAPPAATYSLEDLAEGR